MSRKIIATKSEYPHAYLYQAAKDSFEIGEYLKNVRKSTSSQEEKIPKALAKGYFYQFLNSMSMSVFSLEAFLNLIGAKNINGWNILEKKLNPIEKTKIISDEIGYKIDWGKRPFQTLKKMQKFRNAVVHAKPMIEEEIEITKINKSLQIEGKNIYNNNNRWINDINENNAKRFLDDLEGMARSINKHLGDKNNPFTLRSQTSFWGTPD